MSGRTDTAERRLGVAVCRVRAEAVARHSKLAGVAPDSAALLDRSLELALGDVERVRGRFFVDEHGGRGHDLSAPVSQPAMQSVSQRMRATGAARAGARTLPCRSSGSATAEAELDMSPHERLAEGAAAAMVGCLAGGHVGEAAANFTTCKDPFESSTNFAPAPRHTGRYLMYVADAIM